MNVSNSYNSFDLWEEENASVVRVICQDEYSITYMNSRTDEVWVEQVGAVDTMSTRSLHVGK